MNWQLAINECHSHAAPFAVATVLGTTGSTPRGANAKMVITSEATYDSIGGGQLELLVTSKAREMLALRVPSQKIDHFPLASKANQCCGGSVTVLIEAFPVTAMRLAVFGAGHIGSALVQILNQCDARIDWIDSRDELFPTDQPANVGQICLPDPVEYVASLTAAHRCIVVTHDHALDYRLIYALLTETDIDYVGLIGSATKANRFMDRLRKDGVSDAERQRCRSPIGLPGVRGKLPMEIAVSIAAEILSLDPVAVSEIKPEITWKEIQQVFRQ